MPATKFMRVIKCELGASSRESKMCEATSENYELTDAVVEDRATTLPVPYDKYIFYVDAEKAGEYVFLSWGEIQVSGRTLVEAIEAFKKVVDLATVEVA